MLTLRALLEFTPDKTKVRARNVSVRIVESVIDRDDNGIFKRVICQALASTIPRTIIFKFYQVRDGKFTINSPTWVHCSDESFTYWWEVADTMRGSSSIINSNGALPRIRNPQMRPGLCKHAYRASLPALQAQAKMIPKVEDVQRTARKLNKAEEGKTGRIRPGSRVIPRR